MGTMRMVPVARVNHGFEARVLVARLGSEGVVAQLRGAVDGPYPVGVVEVLVDERELDLALEILEAARADGADPIEDDDEDPGPVQGGRPARLGPALLALVLVGLVVYGTVSTLAGALD